ncbi:MAG: tyrosine-type recombinase/integrase, partial [Acidobacteriaceae bacterium]
AKLNPGTINRYLSAASAVLTYARKREYIVGAPAIPWQVEAGRRIHWLTADAERAVGAAMLKEGRADEALTLRVLTATGMRWSEFAGLGEGQIEGTWIKLDVSKTDTPRDIPITPELAAELKSLEARGGVPQNYTFRKTQKLALKTAGQSEDLTPHCLRHTTATRLVHADVNLSVVKDFMGHSSLNTTLKYTHVSKQLLQDALEKVSPHAGQSVKNAPQGTNDNQQEVPANQGEVEATPGIEPGCAVLQTDT